jgi:hypothetical protein
VIIHDLNAMWLAVNPLEDHSPLVIDSYAVKRRAGLSFRLRSVAPARSGRYGARITAGDAHGLR